MQPAVLLTRLENLRRKVRTLSFFYGMGLVIASACALLMATVVLDYALNLRSAPRMLVVVAALGVLGLLFVRHVVMPLVSRLTISDVARSVEKTFPEFDDRLRSTVDFLRQPVPGSEMMKQRVIAQTVEMAGRVPLDRAVEAKPMWTSLGLGVGAVAVLVVLASLLTQQFRAIALERIFNPFTSAVWPKRTEIRVLSPVPARVPVGQRIDIRMELARGNASSARAIVHYQYDDGPVQQEFMTRAADGSFAANIDARTDQNRASRLRIWMSSGDDRVDLAPVTVVPRLEIRSMQAAVTPPPYVRNANVATFDLVSAPAVVVEGARIEMRVGFNKALASDSQVHLEPAAEKMSFPPIAWERSGDSIAVGRFIATESIRFRVRATDSDGFSNRGLEEYELIVRPDQQPSIVIENPRRAEDRAANSVVPLQAVAEDDGGVETVELRVERQQDKKQWTIPLVRQSAPLEQITFTAIPGTGDRLRYRINYNWELSSLADANLKPGDVLEYHLVVTDNFNLDGRVHDPVPSGKLRITIRSNEEILSSAIDELRTIKSQTEQAKRAQDRNLQESVAAKAETENKPDLDPADRSAIERLANQQATVASQTRQLSQKVEAVQQRLDENRVPAQELKDLARDVRNDLNRAAENEMKRAAQDLTRAVQQPTPAESRNQALDAARESQADASRQLQRALDRMANIGSLQQSIAKLEQILKEQQGVSEKTREVGRENLGKRPDQMTPEQRGKLENAADQQKELAERTQKAIDELQKTAEQMKKSDPSASKAMEQAAQTAQQQQVSQNQQRASSQARENQQSGAQASQRAAEIGLEMILNDLREAERRRLEELSKKLTEMQKQIELLIRRQASHNLDNLVIQGPEVVAKLSKEESDALLQKAQRDPAQPLAAAELRSVTQSQEQTERNTRDLSRTAEDMPDGAEVAGHLTRAAGRMERAIVFLRQSKLADAYTPPQVEALSALEAAKKIVDEQKNRADDQLAEAQREALKERYVKIRNDQENLNKETLRIEAARDADGNLLRPDLVRLGQMPGQQSELAKRIGELDKDLAAIGAVVYVWANKDIARLMNDVKADLAKPSTDSTVQRRQKRVLDQLDAMIKNLSVEPKKSEFAQEGGGGGGSGGGSSPLPPEAELRLLKALQEGVNGDTASADAQNPKPAPQIEELGERQGELRKLLDTLLQEASQGKMKLGPEPDNKDQLPEESPAEKVEDQELEDELLKGAADADKNEKQAKLIGDRMARSRQRLGLNNDPGKITQAIQKRILDDLDILIDEAREQQAQSRNRQQQQQGQPQQQQGAEQGTAQAQQQGQQGQQSQPNQGSKGAQQSNSPSSASVNPELSRDIREALSEWGQVTPRLRDAQIEGSTETIIEKYRGLIEEYYRSLSTKANQK